eukprot:s247_g19.t1
MAPTNCVSVCRVVEVKKRKGMAVRDGAGPQELLPGVINQIGAENLMSLKRIAEGFSGGMEEKKDEVSFFAMFWHLKSTELITGLIESFAQLLDCLRLTSPTLVRTSKKLASSEGIKEINRSINRTDGEMDTEPAQQKADNIIYIHIYMISLLKG